MAPPPRSALPGAPPCGSGKILSRVVPGARFFSALALLMLLLAVPSSAWPAEAPDDFQDFEAKSFEGSRPGKTPKAGSIGTYLHPFHKKTWPFVSDMTAGAMRVSPPFASAIAFLYLDRNVSFDADPFPGCPKEMVLALDPETKGAAAAGCPEQSQLGSGKAAGFARAVSARAGSPSCGRGCSYVLTTSLQTRVFASGIKNTIYLYTYNELTKGNVIVGTLEKYKDPTGRFGSRIRFVLPRGLIQPTPGVVSQLSTFDSTIPAQSYKGHVLTRLMRCPRSKRIYAGYQALYSNNATPKPGLTPVDGNDFVVSGTSKILSRSGKCR